MPFNYSEYVPSELRSNMLSELRAGCLLEIYRQSVLLGIDPNEMHKDWDMDEAGFTEGSVLRQTAQNITDLLSQLSMIERLMLELD